MVALVLLPGLDGTGCLLSDFANALGPEVEVIVASYPRDIPLGYTELETVARSFLPTDKPFFLLAESFSGPIGIAIAASAPPGLQGLVLCCSFARNPLPMLAPLRSLIGLLPLRFVPNRLLGFFVLGHHASAMKLEALSQTIAQVSETVLRIRAQAALSIDNSADLAHVRVPILYLRASEDRVVSRASAEQVTRLAPHSKVVELPAPHFLLQAQPKEAAGVTMEFMGKTLRPEI